ncbi:hypothetical protein J2W54_004953 [Rhodococcus fascians]|uniref:hypothetical protein n=1 Tax=Nocardiaceae TaxID=85025 RepID=UPI00285B6FD8|nr:MULTISPECIES: hypothetical protein [Rhodococcus]MDR6912940.1 hypothetical protein [Rhodococcus sp. 3258]MDR6934537.1 hypothetical protein [Rhodococcus fascians]
MTTIPSTGPVVLSPEIVAPDSAGQRQIDTTSPEGLRVVTVAGEKLSAFDLHMIYTFRYRQYRARRWVNTELADNLNLVNEPYTQAHAQQDLHTLVIESDTQILRGYGTLADSRDNPGIDLDSSAHQRFVVERDYNIDLADHLDPRARVREGKRLIRDYAMPRSSAGASVPWWVYYAWGRGCAQFLHSNQNAAIVGDGKLNGAISQLRLLGFSVQVLHETTPVPPADDDLFAPMWDQNERSYPFVLTDEAGTLDDTLDLLESILRSGDPTSLRLKLSERREGVTR